MTPIQEPITGKEDFADVSTPVQAIAQFYAAFNGHDNAVMADNWDGDEAVVSNGNQLGGILRSRTEVLDRYSKIFNAPFQVYAEFVDYTVHEEESWFLAVGRERGTFTHDGQSFDFQTRDTRLFRRTGGRWKQVHHHGSFDDPELMARFQQTAKG